MLFDLPDTATLYDALLARDPCYEGRAYVCVSSTGIFCRLTCPARKPKLENCSFYLTVGECIQAGYRACKRCHPMAPAAEAEPAIRLLLSALSERRDHRWSEPDIVRMGLDPSTVRRVFNRHFGMTFLEMARLERLRNGHVALAGGGKVIEAQLDAGFSSPSAFRTAFARLMGQAPNSFQADAVVKADYVDTPLGAMIALGDRTHLHLLEFADRKALPTELRRMHQLLKGRIGFGRQPPMDLLEAELEGYFTGRRARFSVPLAFHGSDFHQGGLACAGRHPGGRNQKLQRDRPADRPTFSDPRRGARERRQPDRAAGPLPPGHRRRRVAHRLWRRVVAQAETDRDRAAVCLNVLIGDQYLLS